MNYENLKLIYSETRKMPKRIYKSESVYFDNPIVSARGHNISKTVRTFGCEFCCLPPVKVNIADNFTA